MTSLAFSFQFLFYLLTDRNKLNKIQSAYYCPQLNSLFYLFFFVAEMVPKDLEKELKNIYNAACELLRHFWSCFPPTTRALEEKATNVHGSLRRFEMAKIKPFEVCYTLFESHLKTKFFLFLGSSYSRNVAPKS